MSLQQRKKALTGPYRSILLSVLFILVLSQTVMAQYSGGDGSSDNPFQIATLNDLQAIHEYPGSHFIQVMDIDASTTRHWNDGMGFEPIGGDSTSFSGSYDGNGYVINKLHINRPNREFVGLFGHAQYAVIKNITLTDANINGENNTGILAGKLINGAVEHANVTGKVNGRTYTGGLLGFNFGRISNSQANVQVNGRSYTGGLAGINRGEIEHSESHGNVAGTANGIGGLVGNNYDGIIRHSFATGNTEGLNATAYGGLVGSNGGEIFTSYAAGKVRGRSYTGGLVGLNRGTIEESYAENEVTGIANGTGGFVGNNIGGRITKSYATGVVTGVAQVGGFAGIHKNNGLLNEVYATGTVTGKKDIGGLIGLQEKAKSSGYWNTETSGQTKGLGTGRSKRITGLNTAEMAGRSGIEHMQRFAFDSVWGAIPTSPPRLLWTMPYYKISEIETNSPIRSGEEWYVQARLFNAGGLPDTSDVLLINEEGSITDSTANLSLQPGDETILFFNWEAPEATKGNYTFILQTQNDQAKLEAQVRYLPEIVRLQGPNNLDNQVTVKPELRWQEATYTDFYRLQISDDVDFDSVLVEADSLESPSYKPGESLNHLTTYYWRVRGENEEETGSWSKIHSFTTVIEKPEPVQLLSPFDGETNVSIPPEFIWSSADRAQEYVFQLSQDQSFNNLAFDTTLTAPDTTYTFQKDLPTEERFFWRVQAKNDGGIADWSTPFQFVSSGISSRLSHLEYKLEQNYPNPFNNTTRISYTMPEASHVRIEVLNMLGQNVATLVNEYKSAGEHSVIFNASDLSSGFYIYAIKARNFEDSRKLTIIK